MDMGPDAALAAVLTAAGSTTPPRPAADPAAALAALSRPGPQPARVVIRYRTAGDAVAAALLAGEGEAEALERWCAAAAALAAAARGLPSRIALAVEPEAAALDPLARALGAAVAAGSAPAAERTATLAALPGAAPAAAPLGDAAMAEAVALWRAMAGPTLVPAGAAAGGDPVLLAARVAELEAERELLAAELALLRDGFIAAALDPDRLHRSVIDIAGGDAGATAFWDREEVGGRPFRWLGRTEEATFETLVPRNRTVRVELAVEIAVDPEAPGALEIALDGEPAEAVELTARPDGGTGVVALFPPRPGADALFRARLSLRPKVALRPPGDPRTLSVGLSRIVVEQLPDPRPLALDGGVEKVLLPEPHVLVPGTPLVLSMRLPAARPVRVEAHLPPGVGARLDGLVLSLNGIPAGSPLVMQRGGALAKVATFVLPDGGSARLALSLAGGEPLTLARVTVADASPRIAAPAAPVPQDIRVDRPDFVFPAFYDIERRPDDELPFRWMGRADDAAVPLDGVAGRTLRVEVHIVHAISEETLENFVFGIGGRFASGYELARPAGGLIVKSALLDAGGAGGEPVRLHLRANAKVDMSEHGDPRTLAVALHKIVVVPV